MIKINKKANALMNLTAIFISMNFFSFFAVSYLMSSSYGGPHAVRFDGDIFDLLFQDSDQVGNNLDIYIQSIMDGDNLSISTDYEISSIWSELPSQQGGEGESSGGGGFSFLDVIRILWAFFATLMNMAITPITIFSIGGMSPLISILIGIPLSILYIMGVMFLIRGVT